MLTRKQALLTLALMTSVPLAWAANEKAPAPQDQPVVQPGCPMAGPQDGPDGDHDMMMGHHGKPGHRGDMGPGPRGMMNNTDMLQQQLDSIKDPKVKAKFIDMVKARLAFEESQIDSTKAWLEKHK
jgi:hypothetical protein